MLKLKNFFIFILVYSQTIFGQPLRVGMELSYPPFETIDTEGNPTGVSVDLATALAESLQRTLEIDNLPFIGLIPALKSDIVDLVISSLTQTPERAKAIEFSKPYLTTGLSLLVKKNSTIHSIQSADTPGKIIVVKQGSTGESYARKEIKYAKVLVLDKESTCVLEVSQGKADAFIYDQFSILKNWAKNSKTTEAILKPFKREQWAIGVKKGNQDLLDEINHFIDKFLVEGGMIKILRKYLGVQIDLLDHLGVEVSQ